MPLEFGAATRWPPHETDKVYKLHTEYKAWYAGDVDKLAEIYGGGSLGATIPRAHPAQYRGGLVGAVSRMWWGRPLSITQGTTRIHVPAPADIASLSADLLYSEPLTYTLPEGAAKQATDRLTSIVDGSQISMRLLEGAEMASYAGGVYLVAFVDTSIADTPMVTVYGHDVAVPEWRHGRLTAVTFWRALTGPSESNGEVYRHLERHEVVNGVGMVFHGLYLGNSERLGTRVALESRPETMPFAMIVDLETGGIATGAGRLDVAYSPNVRPHRRIDGCPLGRSDYDATMPQFDSLDETWSSWMRDIRLAKARLIVPSSYMQSNGAGKGAYFDAEQEIFTQVSVMGRDDQGMQLEKVQFDIRVEQHERTCSALWRTIVRGAGLSQDAFGEETGGPAATATEIGARGTRTRDTRSRKIMYAKPAIEHIMTVLVELDAYHFGGYGIPAGGVPVGAEWPAELPNLESLGRTIQLLDAAKAISTRTKVAMVHPRWSSEQVDEEIALIESDAKASAPAPMPTFGAFGGDDDEGDDMGS